MEILKQVKDQIVMETKGSTKTKTIRSIYATSPFRGQMFLLVKTTKAQHLYTFYKKHNYNRISVS